MLLVSSVSMGASVESFGGSPSKVTHPSYASSILLPVAPEYSTGEVLLAAAYRRLVNGESDAAVDLEDIDGLPERLAGAAPQIDARIVPQEFERAWSDLVFGAGGLASPTPRGAQGSRRLRQLMPLVPELSRVSGVLGKVRSRWQPANLLVSTMYSGKGQDGGPVLVEQLRASLVVDGNDDYFAQFIENSLGSVDRLAPGRDKPRAPTSEDLGKLGQAYTPAWRERAEQGQLPSERFADDLGFVIGLKGRLTRRQWCILMESVIRLGMGMHQLWLCRLNARVWNLCLDAYRGLGVSLEEVVQTGWASGEADEPLLQLAENAIPMVRRYMGEFGQARIGVNLVLWALEDAGSPWPSDDKLGSTRGGAQNPAAAIQRFLDHVSINKDGIERVLGEHGWGSLSLAAAAVADGDGRFLSGAATRNMSFFVRYSLGQIQPTDQAQRQYDQGYLLYRQDQRGNRLLVQPAPSMLMLLVHCCCRSRGSVPASVEDLRSHVRAYGIDASAEELRSGQTARDLERLGLVVDSPDAGGGRLLVDPFFIGT